MIIIKKIIFHFFAHQCFSEQVKISFDSFPEPFSAENFNHDSLKATRLALRQPFYLMGDSDGMYGSESETNELAHTLGKFRNDFF